MSMKIYVYPTDTVWGIGGSIFDQNVYLKVCQIKNHQPDKPVSVLFSSWEMLHAYIEFAPQYSRKTLEQLLALEATLLYPLTGLKKKIPDWITQKSDYVAVRLLTFEFLKTITSELQGPIITTSLNLSGQPPILLEEEAEKFHQTHCNDSVFVRTEEVIPSGHSSSIFKLEENDISFVREGNRADEIRQLCGL